MKTESFFQVILLPHREVGARNCTLAEAQAWMQAYNHVMEGQPWTAVIAEEPQRAESVRSRAALSSLRRVG